MLPQRRRHRGYRGLFVDQLHRERELICAEPIPIDLKVVLIGDSGVGKSGLGLVLKGEAFRATDSTHNRHVWSLESQEIELGDGRTETRETLLWDLAGQPGYRLIHQLHLNEVAVALVVFDANSDKTRADQGIIPGAKLLTSAVKYDVAKELPASKSDKLVFYCASERCSASKQAAERAITAGHTDVAILPAGISGWKAEGQPTQVPGQS